MTVSLSLLSLTNCSENFTSPLTQSVDIRQISSLGRVFWIMKKPTKTPNMNLFPVVFITFAFILGLLFDIIWFEDQWREWWSGDQRKEMLIWVKPEIIWHSLKCYSCQELLVLAQHLKSHSNVNKNVQSYFSTSHKSVHCLIAIQYAMGPLKRIFFQSLKST